jgi:hemerythrin-like metal-binding protein
MPATIRLHQVTTGHQEIDGQHARLDDLIRELDGVCLKKGSSCAAQNCPQGHRDHCNDRLAHILFDLLSFMMEHFSFEERLMRLLPHAPDCDEHIGLHKFAHAELSHQLSQLALHLDKENPSQSVNVLYQTINHWMGVHMTHREYSVAKESASTNPIREVGLDVQLVELLQCTGEMAM